MTRGKYAVKSAKTRAETAGQRADHLKQDLDAERNAHNAEVAALKARIETLSAQLTGSIADLADSRVRRAEADCAEQIRTTREEHRADSLEVFRRLARAVGYEPALNSWHIPEGKIPELVVELAEVLHIPAGEAQQAGAGEAGALTPRQTRRANTRRMQGQLNGVPYVVVRGR